ncbi:Ig-like domain-containing protein [Mycolicibacterium sp. OfavD-34-C]|uniref:Ig-like domain-containing protein n=1 Tax=Mycolicibacterium sp. OfavD-34-C TaxID=2917746 RepID=UPI001EF5BB6A|nr:Ig-like domain-containing protein [Mycolicibacterium sp. OfavD-34-C]MCG7582481.1 Ig-like domain-containing protein [Mycolicibacterium sp. OfavD-34-C]
MTSSDGRDSRRPAARRRAEDFPVRQWLKLGAASAGLGAALLGFSLLGPDAATAAADSGAESSVSQSSDSAEASGDHTEAAQSDADDADDADVDDADDDAEEAADVAALDDGDTLDDNVTDESDTDENDGAGENDGTGTDQDSGTVEDDGTGTGGVTEQVETLATGSDTPSAPAEQVLEPSLASTTDGDDAVEEDVTLAASTAVEAPAAADEPADEPVPAPPWLAPRRTWSDVVADTIDAWTNSTQAWIDSLSVSEERKVELTESFWNLRRTFFNQAPTVAPVQISGLITGPIDGTIGAVDADGDEIIYRLVRGPRQGTVEINADGTYIYTPDADFDGVDTFRVIAIDRGFHVNLLSLLRPIGTRATSLINQGAITFAFNYLDDGTGWTEERRQALEDAATQLLWYFRVNAPVTLTYDVGLQDNDALASAGSNVILDRSGFWRTVVQNKLLTGYDSNGSEADGQIDWNFRDYEWALGDSVESSEYDFVSTAIHELMHSFGFLSYVDEAGKNDERIWTTFDSFVVTSAGARPISPLYRWRNRFDPLLTDEEDGLYFGGAHAIAAFGGLVPLYTPNPWEPGSSMSHLDDLTFTGVDQKIMNAATDTGLGVRVFSAVELAILTDLGYQVVMPDSPPYAAAALWFVLLGGRRRKSKAAPR